jgi:hypothetical protein
MPIQKAISRLVLFVSFLGMFACAGTQPVSYLVPLPPVMNLSQTSSVAIVGFNSENLRLASQLEFLFSRLLRADSTVVLTESVEVLRALSRHAFTTGDISDSLALVVGRELGVSAVLSADLLTRYTEEYSEQKRFRTAAGYAPSSGGTLIRLSEIAYQEPYIDQIVTITAVIRAIDVATGHQIGADRVVASDTLHLVLPTKVENPPQGQIEVPRVTRKLLDRTVVDLSRKLRDRFSWHTVPVTRFFAERVKGSGTAMDHIMSGNWDSVRAIYEQAVKDTPDNPRAWNNLAIAYEQAGLIDLSKEAFNQARRLGPDVPEIRMNRAQDP